MTEPEYFQALQAELHRNGPARPCLLLDLDRVDRNLDRVLHWQRRSGKHVRLVEKSLPCPALLDHLMQRACTRRLMSFHQPFLSQDAARFADADLLLGKPMPARAAAVFYRDLRGRFDPARQLQWLIDTPARLQQYLELARGLDTRMRINIEIDIGLHRGGVETERQLDAMMDLIAAHPNHLQWSGFMGYDPHVVALPRWAGSPAQLEDRAMTWRTQALASRIGSDPADCSQFDAEPGLHDPRDVVAALEAHLPGDWQMVNSSGHCSYYFAHMPSRPWDKFLTIREFGAIGNGTSFAMGVAAACPDETVVLFLTKW